MSLKLSKKEFEKRYIRPAMANLVQAIARGDERAKREAEIILDLPKGGWDGYVRQLNQTIEAALR